MYTIVVYIYIYILRLRPNIYTVVLDLHIYTVDLIYTVELIRTLTRIKPWV